MRMFSTYYKMRILFFYYLLNLKHTLFIKYIVNYKKGKNIWHFDFLNELCVGKGLLWDPCR